jgi:hypothetical protein
VAFEHHLGVDGTSEREYLGADEACGIGVGWYVLCVCGGESEFPSAVDVSYLAAGSQTPCWLELEIACF